MRPHRAERLAEAIREELGRLIASEVGDPRVGLTTVTAVRLSPDLRHARVYVSVIGEKKEEQASLRGLEAAARFLRRELARALALHHVPELSFELDRTPQQAERVEELLRRAKK